MTGSIIINNMRFAILDLGTNTFHILIAEVVTKKNVQQLYRDEKWVFLAENGIEIIATTAIERATAVLESYADVINRYACEVVVAIGTAAFRKATNSDVLSEIVNEILGCEVSVVEGEREAELIYKGVRWACNMQDEVCLLMDIGGGSTEFIIANGTEIFWKKSFPLGASILKQKFHHHEQI
ncbi:MAG: exopolyphosphatase, partial [Pseudomonadota bacterium]